MQKAANTFLLADLVDGERRLNVSKAGLELFPVCVGAAL